ncbi:MAG: sigma-70 family RNA polymerase sigma factor [Bacteroidota bacterium]
MLAINTLSQRADRNLLTIAQFEDLFFPDVVRELARRMTCSPKEAERIGRRVVFKLKKTAFANVPQERDAIQKNIYKLAEKEVLNNHQPSSVKNFGLTEDAFNQMLEELQHGNKTLFERIFLTHFQDCRKFLQHRYRASEEDAYDATMEAMLLFCKRLEAGQISYGNLRFLFTRMAGQIYLKWIKKELPKEEIGDMDLPEQVDGPDEESLNMLNKAWNKMCADCQGILKAFYYEGIALKEIALKTEKTAAAVRKQKQRCMEKLQTLFAEQNKTTYK